MRIIMRQLGPEYERFYVLQFRVFFFFWITDCWSINLEDVLRVKNAREEAKKKKIKYPREKVLWNSEEYADNWMIGKYGDSYIHKVAKFED